MAKGFARIELLGNLGSKPELKTVKGRDDTDLDVLNGKIAVNVDENTVQWYSFELWGARAKAGAGHLDKGSKVLISDATMLEPHVWKNNEGKDMVDMKVRINEWHWLDSKKED